MSRIPNADEVLDAIVALADRFPGQPVGVVMQEDGQVVAGVLSLYEPGDDDWFYNPVALDSSFPEKVEAVL